MVTFGALKDIDFALGFIERNLNEREIRCFYKYICEKHNLSTYMHYLTEYHKRSIICDVHKKVGEPPMIVFMDSFFGYCFKFDYDNANFFPKEKWDMLKVKFKTELRKKLY